MSSNSNSTPISTGDKTPRYHGLLASLTPTTASPSPEADNFPSSPSPAGPVNRSRQRSPSLEILDAPPRQRSPSIEMVVPPLNYGAKTEFLFWLEDNKPPTRVLMYPRTKDNTIYFLDFEEKLKGIDWRYGIEVYSVVGWLPADIAFGSLAGLRIASGAKKFYFKSSHVTKLVDFDADEDNKE
ncbi:hypothetical protein H0H92_013395 [Tricholoma furcatifolium]|nr:hypothetical protein H0H92_013395 [Tricholoma furcatifolium]